MEPKASKEPKTRTGQRQTAPLADAGGEPLEGSGFENEKPEPGFIREPGRIWPDGSAAPHATPGGSDRS